MLSTKEAAQRLAQCALGLIGIALLCAPSALAQDIGPLDCCPVGALVPGELTVIFDAGTTPDRVEEIAAELGATVIALIADFPSGSFYVIGVPVGQELALIPLFEAFPEVADADLNGIDCPEGLGFPRCECCPQGLSCLSLPPCAAVGGSVTRVSPTVVMCRNLTTKQSIKIRISDGMTAWNCEQAGLVVKPGDRIQMTIQGPTD